MANRAVINEGVKKIEWHIHDEVLKRLDDICRNLLLDAVIENRRRHPSAHQFTGNLINSIVVILFDRMEGAQYDFFAYDRLRAPIRREMSARTSRKTTRKNAIHFRPDWQNTPHSMYRPEVETDESYGPQDARAFASSFRPLTNKMFEICVAYTSEYAEWVEINNHTTGFLNSQRFAKQVMVGYGFKKIA